MADFDLRARGEFLDVEAPTLCDPLKQRSASAPPCKGGNGVCGKPDHHGSSNNNQNWGLRYLALLPERAATLQELAPKYKNFVEGCPTGSEHGSNATKTTQASSQSPEADLSSSELGDSKEIQSNPPPDKLANSEQMQSMLFPHVRGSPQQKWSDMPETQFSPLLAQPISHEEDKLGNSKHMLSMSLPHALGCPQQMWSNMPETQHCPLLAKPFPHEETTPMAPITTLMLCDIPCRLSIHTVIDVMNRQGFANTFDFIYMPRPRGVRSEKTGLHHNLGYAFVNFKTPEKATEFAATFSDVAFPGGRSTKCCYTKPAQRQGYTANWKKHSRQHKSGCCLIFDSTGQ